MTITERQVGGVTVLDLSGKLISDFAGQLKKSVTGALVAGHKQIILNLGGITYIDSSGLGEMASCYTTVTRAQGRIKLVNLGKHSQELLVMTKLYTVFDVHDTEQRAIAAFA